MCDEDVAALVVDNGSGMCKAGFAGDDAPSLAPGCDWSFTVKIICWPVRVPQRVLGTTFTETASIPLTIIVSFWHAPISGPPISTSSNSSLNWQMLESHLFKSYMHIPAGAAAG